jgi:hypothetical protein
MSARIPWDTCRPPRNGRAPFFEFLEWPVVARRLHPTTPSGSLAHGTRAAGFFYRQGRPGAIASWPLALASARP